jgi:translation initiation factor 3 subunit C
MSKFFVNAEDVEESDEEVQEEEQKAVETRPVPAQRKAPAYDSDDDDDDRKGVMRPEKEKRFGILKEIVKRIVEKIKINDFQHILTDFDELNKQLEKSKRVIEKEGIPLTYVRTCYLLENLCNNLSEEDKKKLKTQNANAFKLLKQKVKKNNKNYQKQLEDFAKVRAKFLMLIPIICIS